MIEEAKRLRALGHSYALIGQLIGKSPTRVFHMLNPDKARIMKANWRARHPEKAKARMRLDHYRSKLRKCGVVA